MIQFIKSTRLYVWVVGALTALLISWGWYQRKQGENSQQEKQILAKLEQEQATRKRVQEANDKINSSDSYVSDWLHKNDRFRD